MALTLETVDSALGTILVVSDGRALRAVDFADCEARMMALLKARDPAPRLRDGGGTSAFCDAIRGYLAGEFAALDPLPAEPGGTAFQRRVWTELRRIPAGATTTYGALAARLGAPTASRAVGRANALNPIAIVVPCHRVIGAGGALTGYAGGVERKRWLLAHEGRDAGGWGGIRTHGGREPSPVFKTGAINRSATHPDPFR